jgi:hypothetical protein
MSLVEGFFVARHTASTLGRIAVLAMVALVVEACGDDHEDTGSAVAAACSSSCNATSGRCNVGNLAPGCSALCDLGYSLVPACGAAYQNYVNCAGASPIVSCNGNAVTVAVTVPPCLDQLGSYLDCAVKQTLTGCVELPLENGACVDAKLGNRATACIGAPTGCSLLTGTVQAGGLGVYCCP